MKHVNASVSLKMTNTIAKNVSINCRNKNVRYQINCYIFHRVLLTIILILIITIICYHYEKHRSKIRWCTNNIKIENNESKKVCIRIRECYYFDDIIKLGDFGFDNILIGEKSHKIVFIYDISYNPLIGPKPLRLIW